MIMALLMLAFTCSGFAQSAATDLGHTTWQLVNFKGMDGTIVTADDKSKYTISFEPGGSVSARIDCNRGRGTWKSSGNNQLTLGPMAVTRAMCPPGSLFDRLTRDLGAVTSYTLKDGHLFLALKVDSGIYEFEPMGGTPPAPVHSAVSSTGPFTYQCTHHGRPAGMLKATFYQTQPGLVLVERANQTRPGFQVLSADGGKYEGQTLMFWEARGQAQVTWSGAELTCKPSSR
jgi:heat shock protein HslJ/membrane-bound inhibitor of C-type lysozyme